MKKIFKIIVLSIFCVSLIACNKKSEDGLILKTYQYSDTEKIILKEEVIEFKDVDFTDAFNTLAQISVSKELGQNLNNISQEEINEKIKTTADEFISQAALKNNTEYKYTYDTSNKMITITSGNFKFNIEVMEVEKESYLKFYHNDFK